MKKLLFFICICLYLPAFAQQKAGEFNSAFKSFASDPDFKHATISIFVIDTKSGKTITEVNTETGLAPASCQKVITAATAYALLGKDFRYTTDINYTGKIVDGVLHGNIIIQGNGDPTLGSWRYSSTKEDVVVNSIVKALSQAGINEIDGHVLVDESAWDSEVTPDGWIWQDIGNYYGAGARALNWRENQYDLLLNSGSSVGSHVDIVGTIPAFVQGLHLTSKLTAGAAGSGDNAYIYLPLYGSTGYVGGTIPVNQSKFSISGAMPDAASQLAIYLEAALKKQTPQVISENYLLKNPEKSAFGGAKKIYTWQSPTLDSICYWFLQKSINLYGEALLKTMGKKFGKGGSTSAGVKVVQDFWKKQGIDDYALNIVDGSGLSPQNRITTDDLVKVMIFAKKQNWFPGFYDALPMINKTKMKSGSINGVLSYTGFINGKEGDYVFAIIVNNYNAGGNQTRRKMWKLLDVLK